MELSKAAKRWVVLTVALLFLVATGSAEAYPGVEPSSPDRTIPRRKGPTEECA